MEVFLIGFMCGIGLAVLVFVILNLENPTKVDDFEDDVRDHADSYHNAKADLAEKAKKVKAKLAEKRAK